MPRHLQTAGPFQYCGVTRRRYRRIASGINLLESSDLVYRAFRFANEALGRTQARRISCDSYSPGTPIDNEALAGRWRPFQLGFILSCLPEMLEPTLPERSIVDVLFYPTGGGKTEAYLGLAAMALALRRMRPSASNGGAGCSILLRYTLRLLTTQQFARAASLVCACESIRLYGSPPATEAGFAPFGIGLWVGPLTPGSLDDAALQLRDLQSVHRDCWRNCATSKRSAPT